MLLNQEYADDIEDLKAHYLFNTGSGNILYDHSGHQNHGAIHGATWEGNESGCTDQYATNYNFEANWDDGSCIFEESIELNQGANLVGINVAPLDLDMFPECVTDIIAEGVAASYIPGIGWVGSITEINCGDGYWVISSSDDCVIQYEGDEMCPDSYQVNIGYNLISYPCNQSGNISDVLPDNVEFCFD